MVAAEAGLARQPRQETGPHRSPLAPHQALEPRRLYRDDITEPEAGGGSHDRPRDGPAEQAAPASSRHESS